MGEIDFVCPRCGKVHFVKKTRGYDNGWCRHCGFVRPYRKDANGLAIEAGRGP